MTRFLGPNDDCTLPGVVVFVDTESRGKPDRTNPRRELHTFRLGCAVAGRIEGGELTRRKTLDFTSPDEFWRWVDQCRRKDRPVWLFAHNLGFDLTMLAFWDRMTAGEFMLHRRYSGDLKKIRSARLRNKLKRPRKGLIVTDDPPTVVSGWHKTGWKLTCLDTLNWFEMSAERLGELVMLDKLPMPEPESPDAEWFTYCRRDVEIIERAVCQFALWQRRSELGRFAFTLAGQALAAFRHRWLPEGLELSDDQERRDFERSALFAGRLQAFWVGGGGTETVERPAGSEIAGDLFRPQPRGPFLLLDANSFYGAVMLETPCPLRCVEYRPPGTADAGPVADLDGSCLARVELDTPEEQFPVKTEAGSLFATGRFVTTLAGPELARALQCGAVKRVYAFARYHCAPIFSDYAAGVWELVEDARDEGKPLIVYCAKAMLSRLAGKFSQRIGQWRDRPELSPAEPWDEWTTIIAGENRPRRYRSIAWDVQECEVPEDAKYSFPALTAWVTAAGREWLLSWIRLAGESHVLYCATDALIVDQDGYRKLDAAGVMHAAAMGFLKVAEVGDTVEIRGPAHYRIGERVVIAGRDRTHRMLTPDCYSALRFQTLRETLARKGEPTIRVEELRIGLPRREVRGTVRPDGWVTAPHLEHTE